MPLQKTLHLVPPEPDFRGSLSLKDPVTKQPDLGIGYRDPEGYLGQDLLSKTIFLYSAEGLLPFGGFSTRLGTGEAAPDSRL